jgi:hypothetical protein
VVGNLQVGARNNRAAIVETLDLEIVGMRFLKEAYCYTKDIPVQRTDKSSIDCLIKSMLTRGCGCRDLGYRTRIRTEFWVVDRMKGTKK